MEVYSLTRPSFLIPVYLRKSAAFFRFLPGKTLPSSIWSIIRSSMARFLPEVNMRTATPIVALILVLAVAISCRLTETLTGDSKAGTVSNLWPDVPPLAGATKTDLAFPLGARLAIRAMMQGKINFIAFTTDHSAQDVKDFYSKDRMKAAGWTPSAQGCIGD